MIMRRRILYIAVLVLPLILSCTQEQKIDYAQGGGEHTSPEIPEDTSGDRSDFSPGSGTMTLREVISGKAHSFSEADEIYLKSNIYHPTVDPEGNVSLDVPSSSGGEYIMFLYPQGSRFWFISEEEAPLKGLIIPYSQFFGTTAELLAQYPMKAVYSGSGNLEFQELISAVSVEVRGDAALASVHLQNNSSEQSERSNLAGMADYNLDGEYELSEGVNFVNLNCTNYGEGVRITEDGKKFYLLIAPGRYPDGLTLTLTGMDHKGEVFRVKPFEVAPGEIAALEEEGGNEVFRYSPDGDLLFFEHFDNFVWGGNVQGNQAVSSYAPDATSDPNETPGLRSGYEQSFTKVGTVTPGSAFIQTNWASVSGWTVGDRHNVSHDYVKSRNIGDIVYMYRCQEFQGCISVGGADDTRGGFTPFKAGTITDFNRYYSLQVSFDVCLRYDTKDRFGTQLSGSGIASKVLIDGEEVELQNSLDGNNTYSHSFQNMCTFDSYAIPGPKSTRYEEGWHHVEITLRQLNELSLLGLWGKDLTSAMKHGALIDNVEIRRIPEEETAEKTLKVLMWNIQYGMWADQANDFDNFAAFIKKYDPDVCVFCEAKSYWADGVATATGSGNYHLFKNNSTTTEDGNMLNAQWAALAKRWGHSYHACSNNSQFPQVITSKTPIKTIRRYPSGTKLDVPGEPQVSLTRGAGHFQITSYGKTINVVATHLWPFKYRKDNPESKSKREGYDIQRREMKAVMHETITQTDKGENWLVMGDMNSVSPLDEDYLIDVQYGEYINYGDKWTLTHKQVLQSPERPADSDYQGTLNFGRAMFDMVREGKGSYYTGPGRMITSTGGNVRYGMMYGSASMRDRVTANTLSIHDSWSLIKSTAQYDPDDDEKQAKRPSDHLPVFVEFDMSK